MPRPVRVPFLNPRRAFDPCDENDTHPLSLREEYRTAPYSCAPIAMSSIEALQRRLQPFDPSRDEWGSWFQRWETATSHLSTRDKINNIGIWLDQEGQEVVGLIIWMTGFGDTIEQKWRECLQLLSRLYE